MNRSVRMIFSRRDGQIRMIYDEQLTRLAGSLGPSSIRRASHVEPESGLSKTALASMPARGLRGRDCDHPATAEQWFADMTPSGGPVLGPFPGRGAALAAELDWLTANGIPVPVQP